MDYTTRYVFFITDINFVDYIHKNSIKINENNSKSLSFI